LTIMKAPLILILILNLNNDDSFQPFMSSTLLFFEYIQITYCSCLVMIVDRERKRERKREVYLTVIVELTLRTLGSKASDMS